MARLTLDWLHIVALLGAAQGLFLAGVLATKRSNRTANRLLAAAMLAFSIFMATGVYHAARLEPVFPHFFGVSYPITFIFGPLIYLYAVAAADRTYRLTWRDALHFAPFLLVVLTALPVYLMSGAEKLAFYEQVKNGMVTTHMKITLPLRYISGITYTILTLLFLRRHSDRIKDSYSSTERVNLRWLVWLVGGVAAIWLMALAFQLVESAGITRVAQGDDYIALGIAILVYGIGYRGLRQPEIFRYETAEHPVPTLQAAAAPPEPEPVAPRYEKSGLSDRQAERLKEELLAVMDKERPWQNSELTLADLATRLNTTPHKLSEVLNAQLGQTFYDFVNGYRVREVQRRIAAGEARRVKMLSLALDAGFASKSTFNLVFKKYTSQTPSDFRQAAGM
jgi:AraC-like DNA-binding protein